jgi:hypothetical protein
MWPYPLWLTDIVYLQVPRALDYAPYVSLISDNLFTATEYHSLRDRDAELSFFNHLEIQHACGQSVFH